MSIDSSFDTPEHFEQESQTINSQRGGFATRLLRDQPLVAAAIGIAFGALIGAALPISAREKQLASQARARLMDHNPLAADRQSSDTPSDLADTTGMPGAEGSDIVGHPTTGDPKAAQGPGSSSGLG
jgi:hypothetical protein